MKKAMFLLTPLLLFSLSSLLAQPASKKAPPKPAKMEIAKSIGDSIVVKGEYKTDTVAVRITHTKEDGYLKKVKGFLIIRSFVSEGRSVSSTQTAYDEKWVLFKPDEVDKVEKLN